MAEMPDTIRLDLGEGGVGKEKAVRCRGLTRTDLCLSLTCLASAPPCVAGHSVSRKTLIHPAQLAVIWRPFSKTGQNHKSETFGEFTTGNRKSKAKLLPSTEPAKSRVSWVSLKGL